MARCKRMWYKVLSCLVPILLGLLLLAPVWAADPMKESSPGEALGSSHDGGQGPIFKTQTGASAGFISVPTARALVKPARWLSQPDRGPPNFSTTLAIVGLPVDFKHAMLTGVNGTTYCLARESRTEKTLSLCKDPESLFENFAYSGKFNLCDFDEDCWHSTAVALLASGNKIDPNIFSFGKMRRDSRLKENSFRGLARSIYTDFEYNTRKPLSRFLNEEMAPYKSIMDVSVPYATTTYNGYSAEMPVTSNMVVDRGVRSGGAIFAFNVFSRFDDPTDCARHKKVAPCVLTTLDAQERALAYILSDVLQYSVGADKGRPIIGAIVIIAGGYLTDQRCDDTRTAKLIAQLASVGVPTFVPTGNDGDPKHVRFPACASQAISVGSLTRDGAVAPFSNGRDTGMVNLYVDGETVVLAVRGGRARPPPGYSPFEHCVRGYKTNAAYEKANDDREKADDPDYKPDDQPNDPPPAPEAAQREREDSWQHCELREDDDQYDVYVAGGTLLSAAVAAGSYLNLHERHPGVTSSDVMAALRTQVRPGVQEVNERAAYGALRRTQARPARTP